MNANDFASLALFVKEWQPLVGSLLGFFGVMVTLYFNASLGRKTDRIRMDKERLTLIAALLQDMIAYQIAVQHRIHDLRQLNYNDFYVAIQNDFSLYQASHARFGLLAPHLMSQFQILVNARSAVMAHILLIGEIQKEKSSSDVTVIAVPHYESDHLLKQYIRINQLCSESIKSFGGQPVKTIASTDRYRFIWWSFSAFIFTQLFFLFIDPSLFGVLTDSRNIYSYIYYVLHLFSRILRGRIVHQYFVNINEVEKVKSAWLLISAAVLSNVLIRTWLLRGGHRFWASMARSVKIKPRNWAIEPFNTLVKKSSPSEIVAPIVTEAGSPSQTSTLPLNIESDSIDEVK